MADIPSVAAGVLVLGGGGAGLPRGAPAAAAGGARASAGVPGMASPVPSSSTRLGVAFARVA